MITNLTHRRTVLALAALATVVVATSSCGDLVRSGRSPVMMSIISIRPQGLIIASTLQSDVASISDPCSEAAPCVLADLARATITVVMKDVTVVAPSTNNQVMITRYRVTYRRTDGRNTPGVDVPYGFDGGVTVTIAAGGVAIVDFEIVRPVAKLEAPLVNLRQNPTAISAIADVTFFGTDQVGNDVSVTGSVLVDFGNFGDDT